MIVHKESLLARIATRIPQYVKIWPFGYVRIPLYVLPCEARWLRDDFVHVTTRL